MDRYSEEEKISAGVRSKRKFRHFKRRGVKRKFFLVMPYSVWPDRKQKAAKYAEICRDLGYHIRIDTFGSSDEFAVYAWNQDNSDLPQIADISSFLNEQDAERYNWHGKHFPLAKDLALFYIGLLREIVSGKPISREKEIQEYAMKSMGIELSGDTIKGLYHWHQRDSQKGPFFWMGFDGRMSTWSNMKKDEALLELANIENRIRKLSRPLEQIPTFDISRDKRKYREFPIFKETDFAVFERRKISNRRYNPNRKAIWERMKIAQQSIDSELNLRDIQLNSKLSRYYPNRYNKFRVGGIWIGHSDANSRYFEKPHLSFGIYEGYLFAGLVVNEVAVKELERIANLIEHDPPWFLQIFGNLDPEHRVIWSGGVEIELDVTPGQLSLLCTQMRKEWDWFSFGIAYLPEECPDCCEGLAEKIADTYESLLPLYNFVWSALDKEVGPIIPDSKEEWEEGEELDESDIVIQTPGGESRRGRPHPRLSRLFRNWIRENYSGKIRKETRGIDVEFEFGGKTVCAELKTESEGSTKYMIRSALGQLLEYNLYPARKSADEWLIVLDTQPSRKDKSYIDRLRGFFPKPLHLCWLEKKDFVCYPSWPKEKLDN